MLSLVNVRERPRLRDPFLVLHLSGWTDAGLAGQTAAAFLRARWNSRSIAEFDLDELIDYRARRPIIRLAGGTIEQLTWSPIELAAGTTAGGRDVLLLTGPEPDFRWNSFIDQVLELCHELPVAVLGTSADPELAGRLETVPAIIELQAGIQSVLEERLYRAGIPATGLWARVPPYLAGGTHPPAALALVESLARLVGVEVDATELVAASKEHLEQVEQAIRERPQIAEFIGQIRALVEQGGDDRIPSGEEIAAELERFLSQQPPDEDGPRG